MTKQAILKAICDQFSLKRADADVLVRVAMSNQLCEIDFPADVTEQQRANYLKAYDHALELVERMEQEAVNSLSPEAKMVLEEPLISIDEVVGEVQRHTGNALKVHELGIRWGKEEDLTQEQFMQLICRLYASFLKTKRIKAFLEWAIADACNISHKLYGNMQEIVEMVSCSFNIGPTVLQRMCYIARLVPVYMRIPGWTHRHYEKVVQYAGALKKGNIYATMKKLEKGREMDFKLSCGASVKSLRPLNPRQVEEELLKETGIRKKTRYRSNSKGYLYLSPLGPSFSRKLDRKALQNPTIKVVDLSRVALVKQGGGTLELQQYDPALNDFFVTGREMNRA